MEIKYLVVLGENPIKNILDLNFLTLPLSLEEVSQLELRYNNDYPFPIALKELLYLAGSYCHVLNYGDYETQQELQEFVRGKLLKEHHPMPRPFFVIEICKANFQFLFIYLDEGNNPPVYKAHYDSERLSLNQAPEVEHQSLSDLISSRIERFKNEGNSF